MLIDCRKIAAAIDADTQHTVELLNAASTRPTLCEIIATDNDGVLSYARTKQKKAASLGVAYTPLNFSATTTMSDLIARVDALNADHAVHGIIVGMPVFVHLDGDAIAARVAPEKDVDGLAPLNVANVSLNQEDQAIAPATAVAAVRVAESVTRVGGKRVLVLGRGRTVGRPVAAMLTNRDATVTVAHSRSGDLAPLIANAEIIVSAMGMPSKLPHDVFVEGQILVDCGIAFADGKTVGDFDGKILAERGVIATSVPGGVGTVTNAILFANLMKAMQLQGVEV